MRIKNIFLILTGLIIFSFFSLTQVRAEDTCTIDSSNPECQGGSTINQNQQEGEIQVCFFYTPGCLHCKKVSEQINLLSQKYDLNLESINAKENPQKFKSFLKTYDVPFADWGKVPIIFIGDRYLLGDKECCDEMETIIKEVKSQGKTQCLENKESNLERINFYSIGILALVDSVNPCALTIFLLLLITLIEQKRFSGKRTFVSALTFIIAIFISYFILGILIAFGFKGLALLNLNFNFWVYRIIGSLAVLLGVLNIIDFARSKAGTCKIQPFFGLKIRRILEKAFSPLGMFFAGILISVFLLPCSSGPYFVAGGLLASQELLKIFLWLIYYNLIIVLPIFTIALIVSFALVKTESISNFLTKNMRFFSLVAGLLLIALGIWVLFF